MRDINRIEKVLYELGKLWARHPDYRFGQLLINYGIVNDDINVWTNEDDILLKFLKKLK